MGSGSAFECPQGLAVPKQETNVMEKLPYSSVTTVNSFSTGSPNGSSTGSPKLEGVPDQFPAGLRVLVVDDDPTCLKILERMLRRCLYEVTTCCRATVALSMLRERKGSFDLVISDVYMPDMDGFKLLEHVGLEMDLPVIMMSADGETSVVMKGIKHGACDYLLKPVRIEALKNIWQHVIRKKRNESKELEHSGSVEDSDRHKKGSDDVEYASSVNEGTNGNWKQSKKRKEAKEEEDDGEQDNEDSSTLKKPRVVWSVELHQQFVCAVNQLGIDKAVPKRILELMNVQGLTRENVASHLQKYRLYLRRLSGVGQQQPGMSSSFGGTMEANFGSIASLERPDLQALAASGQLSRQTLAAFQAGLIGRGNASNGLGMPGVDTAFLLQPELQGVNCSPPDRVRFGQPLLNSRGNLLQGLPTGLELRELPQSHQHIPSFGNVGLSMDDMASGIPIVQQQLVTASAGVGGVGQVNGMNNIAALNPHNNALMAHMIKQQQRHTVHRHQQQMPTGVGQQQQPVPLYQGEQLEGGQVLNLSSAGHLLPQTLSNDIGEMANPLSTIGNSSTGLGNTSVDVSNSGQLGRMPTPADNLTLPASHASVGIRRMPTIDYENQFLPVMPGSNYSLTSTVGPSTPLTSIGTGGDMSIQGVGSFGGMSDIVNSQTLRGSDSNFSTFSGLGQNLSQSNKQGWNAQNLALNSGSSQTGNLVPSSRYSEAFSATQGLNIPGTQDKGQVRSFGYGGQGLGLPSRLSSDAGHMRVIKNTHCQSEQSVDSGSTLRGEGLSDFMASSKFEDGLLPQQFSQDDLMSVLFKQQHEGTGIAEGEFNMDGYQLNNIHVK
eukprot:Gb_32182 [translate_table: standard]